MTAFISIPTATLVGCPSPIRAVDPAWVARLVRLGAPFSPVVVAPDGASGWVLVDGAHRVQAALALGIDTLPATVVSVSSEGDLLEAGLRANCAKGLSMPERKAAGHRLLRVSPSLSDRRIADLAGVSHRSVGRWRSEAGECAISHRRIGRDEKSYPASYRRQRSDLRGWWPRFIALVRRLFPFTLVRRLKRSGGHGHRHAS
jgi:predicted HicB family RNase H-like nuclease